MRLPGNSVLSSTKEDHQNKLRVTCYLLSHRYPQNVSTLTCTSVVKMIILGKPQPITPF